MSRGRHEHGHEGHHEGHHENNNAGFGFGGEQHHERERERHRERERERERAEGLGNFGNLNNFGNVGNFGGLDNFGGLNSFGNAGIFSNQGNNILAQEIAQEVAFENLVIEEENAELIALRMQRQQQEAELRIQRQQQLAEQQQLAQIENARFAEQQRLAQIENARLIEQQRIEHAKAAEQHRLRQAEHARLQALRDIEYAKEQAELARQQQLADEAAEEARRLAYRQQAQLQQEQEDKNEDARVAVYDSHQALIAKASGLNYDELEKSINALATLIEPIERFTKTEKKGLPLQDGKTLFYHLVMNPLLSSEQKAMLIDNLFQRGYLPYLNRLFSTPIIELLLSDANPVKLLQPIYMQAVFNQGMVIIPELEPQIWVRLMAGNPLFANIMLDSLLASNIVNHQKITQFLSNLTFADLGSLETFYIALLTRNQANMTRELSLLIQTNFLATSQNDWAALSNVYLMAQVKTEDMLAIFSPWVLSLRPDLSNMPQFVAGYEAFLTNRIQDSHLRIEPSVWSRVLQLDERACDHLYTHLSTTLNAGPHLLMPLLHAWATAYNLPHNFAAMSQHYLNLLTKHNIKNVLNDEEKIWEALIRSDVNSGPRIFDHLVLQHSAPHKLVDFVKCWMQALTQRQDIVNANALIERRASQLTTMPALVNDLKLIIEARTLNHAYESKSEDDEHTVKITKESLESTKTHIYSIGADKKHAPYNIYHEIRHKAEQAKRHLDEEMAIIEQHINADLNKANEPARFTFK
jgi:hypothetical protein